MSQIVNIIFKISENAQELLIVPDGSVVGLDKSTAKTGV